MSQRVACVLRGGEGVGDTEHGRKAVGKATSLFGWSLRRGRGGSELRGYLGPDGAEDAVSLWGSCLAVWEGQQGLGGWSWVSGGGERGGTDVRSEKGQARPCGTQATVPDPAPCLPGGGGTG